MALNSITSTKNESVSYVGRFDTVLTPYRYKPVARRLLRSDCGFSARAKVSLVFCKLVTLVLSTIRIKNQALNGSFIIHKNTKKYGKEGRSMEKVRYGGAVFDLIPGGFDTLSAKEQVIIKHQMGVRP